MSDFGPALNGITVGSWLNAMLYMLEIVQLSYYIKHFWKRDKLPIKSVVILCFVIDTACTIAICAWVFLSDVVHWGDVEYLTKGYWPVPTKVLCTSAVAALVQSFLISRYYLLSGQRIISLILGIFMLISLAGGTSVAVVLVFYSSIADRYKGMVTTPVWLVFSGLADVCIAVALVISLARAGSKTSISSTKRLISRLIVVAIQSGSLTTILALLLLSSYLMRPTTNDSAYFSFCLGRAYTLTMLFNLNLRMSLEKGRGSTANTFGAMGGNSGSNGPFKSAKGGSGNRVEIGGMPGVGVHVEEEVYPLGGIQVHRTAHLSVDDKKGSTPFGDSVHEERKIYEVDAKADSPRAL